MIAKDTYYNRIFNDSNGFELLFNSTSDVVFILDRNKNISICNTAFLQIFHVAKSDVIGQPFSVLHSAKYVEENLKHDFSLIYENLMHNSDIVFETGQVRKYSERITLADCSRYYFSISISPIIVDNSVHKVLVSVRDISADLQISPKDECKKRLLLCLLDELPICAFLKRRCDNVVIGNGFLKRLLLLPDEPESELTINEIFSKDYLKLERQEDQEIYKNKRKLVVERLVKFSTLQVWCKVYKIPLFDSNGEVCAIVVMYENITTGKECESEREFFIKTLLHDLKVPTIAQLRGVQLLQNETLGNVNTAQKEVLDEIVESCSYVLDMISTIICAYRFDNGENALGYRRFYVTEMLNECSKIMKNDYKYPVELSCSVKPASLSMLADSNVLKMVIVNLIIKFMTKYNPQKKVSIKVEGFEKFVRFVISTKETHSRGRSTKWIPFKSLLSNLKFITVGYGIELYLCHKIISLHKGSAYVEMNDINIEQFRFEIPRIF